MWSYAASTSNLDQVRFYIGDVYSTAQLIQDEVIDQALSLSGSSPIRAAIKVCEMQASVAAQDPTMLKVGDLSVSRQAQGAGWAKRAESLRTELSYTATPFVGGSDVSDKKTRRDDTTKVQPFFDRLMLSHNSLSTSST
jgi:hypothetical protein